MLRALWLLTGSLLLVLLELQNITGIVVELSEILQVGDDAANGEYETLFFAYYLDKYYGGVDPIDYGCSPVEKCIALLTRDGSVELDSRYGCTEPALVGASSDDSRGEWETCGVRYSLSAATMNSVYSLSPSTSFTSSTIASVKIALHPDSISNFTLRMHGVEETYVENWEAAPGSTEFQDIPVLEGLAGTEFDIIGVMEPGEYLGILEMEIYVTVDEVETTGTSATTRASISATATTDASSAMNTLDGDATGASSWWTCSSGEVCEITYDLQATESLDQLRIGFSERSDAGGTLNFMAAGESGVFSAVRTGIDAGGRPVGIDGLQTFGGVRALARYVKIEVIPPSGGSVLINEVQFRVGDDAPQRPVAEKKWLKPTGPLPLPIDPTGGLYVNHDGRAAENGGCDSPAPFEGCHVYYMKDGDTDTRWTCGPLATGSKYHRDEDCDVTLNLNHFRYVRQVQIAFHAGDEQHDEFSVQAYTIHGWMTVVGSAITPGNSTDYLFFDVSAHAVSIKLVPKFHRFNQWFSIKEMTILERRKDDFVAGTVPVFSVEIQDNDDNDDGLNLYVAEVEVPTRLGFDLPNQKNAIIGLGLRFSSVAGLRMRFPADREFQFSVSYTEVAADFSRQDVSETFTSAGGENTWETFTLSEVAVGVGHLEITALSGPTFADYPDYPALRVADLRVVGELIDRGPGYFKMVTTTMEEWGFVPDIIGDGVSQQQEIMTAICETKGGSFDGTDCVGDLDDSTVHISFKQGDYFLDGPIFLKSGVTLDGWWSGESPKWPYFNLYEGTNSRNTGEDAVVVIDGATDVEVENIYFRRRTEATGDIVPGTVGNLCMDIRNSKDLRFSEITPRGCRAGAARFADSSNITAYIMWEAEHETGNYMEFTRVDDFYVKGFPDMAGLLLDTCNNFVWEGWNQFDLPRPILSQPAGGSQTANVVVTGDSSGIVFQNCTMSSGAEPRILMESTMPLTLESIFLYEDAASGDCIVEVPTGSTDDLIVQVKAIQTLSKAGNCWILD